MFMSDMQYYFSFRDRRAVRNNLRNIVASGADIPKLSREVFRNFGKYLVDFFSMALKLDEQFIKDNVNIKNIEVLDRVLQEGKGAILVTAHIGNWELGGMVLSLLGYPLVGIALPHKERPVNDLFNHQRERQGITIIQTSSAIRRSLEVLRENKVIALVADRDFSNNGLEIEFLNRKALLPKGPVVLMVREDDDRFTLVFYEPIYPNGPVSGEIDPLIILGTIKKYINLIEDKIKQYPTQWLMFRKYWIE